VKHISGSKRALAVYRNRERVQRDAGKERPYRHVSRVAQYVSTQAMCCKNPNPRPKCNRDGQKRICH